MTTQSQGDFGFMPKGSGPYVITATVAEGHATSAAFSLSPGESKTVDLRLESSVPGGTARPGSAGEVQFSDEPTFTVAGITDPSAAGGHGSDMKLRTSDSLAKDTAQLESNSRIQAAAAESRETLLRKRDELRAKLSRENTAQNHRLLGDLEEKLNDPVNAVREYETATKLDPSEQNYFFWGTELLLHHAVQPAVEIFSKGTAAHSHSARLLEGLGAALYASGAFELAARAFCQASDLRPEDSAPYLFIGKMQKSLAEPIPCADQKLARFAQAQPRNAQANYYYAVALLKRKDASAAETKSKAETLLLKATASDPKLADAHLQLGILYAEGNAISAAIHAFEQAIQLNPALAEAHYRLARALKASGDQARAQKEFAAYRETERTQTEEFERKRRELQQFVIVLKDQPDAH